MAERLCGMWMKPAAGEAAVNGVPYCHGDWDPSPTCYQRAMCQDPAAALLDQLFAALPAPPTTDERPET